MPAAPTANATVERLPLAFASLPWFTLNSVQPAGKLVQPALALLQSEEAFQPRYAPAPMPMTPTAPTTMATVRCDEPPAAETSTGGMTDLDAGEPLAGVAEGEVSSDRIGTSTDTLAAPAATSTTLDHFCLPGAVASMTCRPGSMGMPLPRAAGSTGVPSRLT